MVRVWYFFRMQLKTWVLPLHMSNPGGLSSITDRFISIPDVILSPQVFLLNFLYPEEFILFNTLLQYSIGFVGLLFIRKKFSLSAVPFTILFFIIRLQWTCACPPRRGTYSLGRLFSAVVVHSAKSFVCWIPGKAGPGSHKPPSCNIHHVLAGIVPPVHVHCIFFLLIISLTGKKYFWPAIGALIASGMLSLIRIFPTMLVIR